MPGRERPLRARADRRRQHAGQPGDQDGRPGRAVRHERRSAAVRRARQAGRFTPYQVGLIALGLIVIVTYLAFTKDIPFTKPYELKARFTNAPPIHKGQAVRIAGVDVGKVSDIQPVGGDSPAITVTMKLDDEALPIHKDARIKVRPRIFFEGNLFFDVHPGTPGSPELGSGATIPASQTSAPVQIDQVLSALKTDTRLDLQKLL